MRQYLTAKLNKIKIYLFEKGIKFTVNKIYVKFMMLIIGKIERIYYTNNKNFFTNKKFNGDIKTNFFYDINEIYIYYLKNNNSNLKNKLLKDAEAICNKEFKFLGVNKVIYKELKWNLDFKSGFIWSNSYYKDIKIVDIKNNSDVKVPWELSRLQHLPIVGKAYIITGKEKYKYEFKNQLNDWMLSNPYKYSVNWTCTMEVAIRAMNLIISKELFFDAFKNDKEFLSKIDYLIYLHGKYIKSNLENKDIVTGNHYIANLVGLLWCGIYLKDNYGLSKKWIEFSVKELESEVNKQINNDGTNYEASTAYHRLVVEFLLYAYYFGIKNDVNFSCKFIKKLKMQCDFLKNISKQNGSIPIIGDIDDGRVFILSKYYDWDKKGIGYTLGLASCLLNGFKKYSKEEEIVGMSKFNINNELFIEEEKSVFYNEGGYYILKNENIYCIIRCGELACKGHGGHSHNDQLSFELNILGKDFIIDPGTYVYTSNYKLRNLFRSTKMHNTIVINDLEQNQIDEKELFKLTEETRSKCIFFNSNQFYGYHKGYEKKVGLIHKRKFILGKCFIEIQDELNGQTEEFYSYASLILDDKVEVSIVENGAVLKNGKIKVFIKFEGKIKLEQINISPAYGVLKKSNRLILYYGKNKNNNFIINYLGEEI